MAVPSETADDQRRYKKYLCLKMVGEYIDNCIHICIVVIGADFIQRLFHVGFEYFYQSRYYLPEDQLVTIFRRAYTYNRKSICFALLLIFAGLTRFGSTGNITHLCPNSSFLAYVPLYWIFSALNLSHSSLSYAHWIREPHGLDYAAGMASNYFHGYLKLSLPERNDDGFRKRLHNYEDTHTIRFGLDRLIILIPDEMFVKGVIKSPLLKEAAPLETTYINRAGVNRPFKHAVYRLTKLINGTSYYFAMEGATPLTSFFEAMNFQMSATWQMQEMKREIWLKFYIHLKELLNSWPETRREVELLIYNTHKPNGERVDVGELLLAKVMTRLESEKQKLN